MDLTSMNIALVAAGYRRPPDLVVAQDDRDWVVRHDERGTITVLGRFGTEAEACADLWHRLTDGAPLPGGAEAGMLASQREYWNGPGSTKTFTHPIEFGWL